MTSGRRDRTGRPVTISDIAAAAGVSKGAASHALNGRPGVSADTRRRVRDVATQLGWTPNVAARALSGSPVGAIGWILQRTAKSTTIDPYFTEFFAGIEVELARTPVDLVVKMVSSRADELDSYRRWAAERRVDGVILVDSDIDDQRWEVLAGLGLPACGLICDPRRHPAGAATVILDEETCVHNVLDHVYANSHRKIGWIAGPRALEGNYIRRRAMRSWQRRHDAEISFVHTDLSAEQGVAAALRLREKDPRFSIFIFDNDLMATAGLSAFHRAGIRVPDDVSIISWVDSDLCDLANPPITALHHNISHFGALTARRLLAVINDSTDIGPDRVELPTLITRSSVSEGPATPWTS